MQPGWAVTAGEGKWEIRTAMDIATLSLIAAVMKMVVSVLVYWPPIHPNVPSNTCTPLLNSP